MGTNLIAIEFSKLSMVYCSRIKLRFPQLFRVTSFRWKRSADGSTLHATDEPAPPGYTLKYSLDWKTHANPTFTPIGAPDANIDQGWVIVSTPFNARTSGRLPTGDARL